MNLKPILKPLKKQFEPELKGFKQVLNFFFIWFNAVFPEKKSCYLLLKGIFIHKDIFQMLAKSMQIANYAEDNNI